MYIRIYVFFFYYFDLFEVTLLFLLLKLVQRAELRHQLCGAQPEKVNTVGQTESHCWNMGGDLHPPRDGKRSVKGDQRSCC